MTATDEVDPAEEAHKRQGFTVAVYFPPQADWEKVRRFFDRVAGLAYDGYFPRREGWDPFVFGHGGDVLGVDGGGDHTYLSTSCLHDDHGYCQSDTGQCGQKTPGVCKFCQAPCICPCHREKEI